MAKQEVTTVDADIDLITGKTLPEIEDRDEAALGIVREILASQDLGTLFRNRTTCAAKDLIGIPLLIRGVRFMRSNIEGVDGAWALIDAVRIDSGEVIAVNTGAKNIMALLLRAEQLSLLPMEVEVVQVGRGRPGENAPIGLVPHGKTAEQARAEQAAQ